MMTFTLSLALPRPVRGPHWLAAVALCSTALSGPAHARLTLEQALRAAQDRSRQLPAQDAAAAASRELAVAAGQRPDPTLKLGLNNLPINGPDRVSVTRDFMTMRSIGVMQELTRADKLGARSARFEREAEVAEQARALALANLRRETATAWLDRHFQERMLELLKAQRAETALQVDAADAAYRGGRSGRDGPADAIAARSAVGLIDDRIRLASQQVASAQTRLTRWVGDAADQPLASAPAMSAVAFDSGPLESQLVHHPEIAMMLGQEAMASAEADIARRNQRADWSVELMLSQRGPAYSNMVSVNVSIPLQLDQKHRQDRELAAKLAVLAQLRAQREEATREHLAQVQVWRLEWQSDRDRLAHFDATLIPLAAERARAALATYRGGGGALAAVLDARRSEIDIRMDRLRLEMVAAGRWAQLEYLVPPAHEAPSPARPNGTTEPRP